MRYRSIYSPDLFASLDQLQRQMQQVFDVSPSIRGFTGARFPAINVGGTPKSVEIYAFAPGLDASRIDVQVDKGVLTLAGERRVDTVPEQATVHINERFSDRFRRVIALSDDLDAASAQASYRDGVLHISIPRKEAAQPRRIAIQ
jgi:HSP20 family protein